MTSRIFPMIIRATFGALLVFCSICARCAAGSIAKAQTSDTSQSLWSSPPVLASIITAGVALLVAIFNSWRTVANGRALQAQKATFDTQIAEQEEQFALIRQEKQAEIDRTAVSDRARVDYEYDARKRLYTECEPLIFQLTEFSELASRRIRAMARTARYREIAAKDFQGGQYYLLSSLYFIFRPLVPYELMRARLTGVDLALDDYINVQFQLGKLLYRSFTHGASIADKKPKIEYRPNDDFAAETTRETAKQDLALGRLDNVIQALITRDTFGAIVRERCLTFGEFENAMLSTESSLRRAFEHVLRVFVDFNPDTRPVLWRLLVAQVYINELIIRQAQADRSQSSRSGWTIEPIAFPSSRIEGFRWFHKTDPELNRKVSELHTSFAVGAAYMRARVKKNLTLAKHINVTAWKSVAVPDLADLLCKINEADDRQDLGRDQNLEVVN